MIALEDNKCHYPLSKGPCHDHQWLAVSDKTAHRDLPSRKTLSCVNKPCQKENEILFNGTCVDGSDAGPACKGRGQEWVLKPDGSAECVCDVGYLPVADGSACVPLFTKGHCDDTQMVADWNGLGVCVPNPCGSSSTQLPHPSSLGDTFLNSSSSFDLQQITCHDSTNLETTDCITELDMDYYDGITVTPLTCQKTEEEVEDKNDIFSGKRQCGKMRRLSKGGKKKMYCKYRKRCVTMFG